MKSAVYTAVFAVTASAAVLPRDQCCFAITASGGVSGVLGQLFDGQTRVNGSYPPATYCYSNGGIVDSTGRGCVVTYTNDATHQFQCDLNRPPTYGFSIANNGSILFQGMDQFYACPATDTEYNVYTTWLKGQDKCKPVKLNTNGTCAGAAPSGSWASSIGGGYSPSAYSSAGSTAPAYSGSAQETSVAATEFSGTNVGNSVTAYASIGSSASASAPAYTGSGAAGSSALSQGTTPVVYSSHQVLSSSVGPVGTVSALSSASQSVVPGNASSARQSVPAYPSQVSVLSPSQSTAVPYSTSSAGPSEATILASSSSSSASGSESGPTASAPIYSWATVSGSRSTATALTYSSKEVTVPAYNSSAVAIPGYSSATDLSVPVVTQTTKPAHASSISASVASVYSTPMQGTPAESNSVSSARTPSTPLAGQSTSYEATVTAGTTIYTTYCPVTATQVSGGSTLTNVYSTWSTLTAVGSSAPVGQSISLSIATQSTPSSDISYSYAVGTSHSAPGYSAASSTSAEITQGTIGSSNTASSLAYSTTTQTTGSAYVSSQLSAPSHIVSTSSLVSSNSPLTTAAGSSSIQSSSITPATSVTGSSCQTSLTGAYQTPHLIVPISSNSPDTASGTSYNATINSETSTIFNFDIPSDYSGKTCTVIFLFPKPEDLETSAYTFSGSGDLVFQELDGVATQSTTYNNAPAVNATLNTIAIQEGNSYVVSTGACAAGTTESIELSSSNGLDLVFFEDWNPSSLGLYITAC